MDKFKSGPKAIANRSKETNEKKIKYDVDADINYLNVDQQKFFNIVKKSNNDYAKSPQKGTMAKSPPKYEIKIPSKSPQIVKSFQKVEEKTNISNIKSER